MSELDLELDFVRLSSYQDATESSGKVVFSKDIEIDIEGKHVLIIEDIVDSGRTMMFLAEVFKARKPASVRICSLIDKTERRAGQKVVVMSPDYSEATKFADKWVPVAPGTNAALGMAYGSDASNGAIIITTKKGRKGKGPL